MRPSRVWTSTARYNFGQFYLVGGGPAPVFDFDPGLAVDRATDTGGNSGDVSEIRTAADSASRTLGRDVNVTVLRPAEWGRGKNRFITHVKSEPLVELDLAW